MVAVFPNVEEFLGDYFSSVNNQTYEDFTVLVLNDKLNRSFLKNISDKYHILDVPDGLNPAQIRLLGMKYARENDYQNLIFSDADDFFSNNRVELSVDGLHENDFVFNEIIPVDRRGRLIPANFSPYTEKIQFTYKRILDYNLLGMGNTGVRTDLTRDFYIPEDIIAVDWWLFTVLLLTGAQGKFVDGATTFYRQTDENIVGMKKPLDKERLLLGIHVKATHYRNLLSFCKKHGFDFAVNDYSRKNEEMKELTNVVSDKEFQKRYINVVNANLDEIYKGWWSEILSISQWSRYGS